MNAILSAFLLLSIPGVPLLLAFPALRSRLSWPCHFALLPAVILLTMPTLVAVDLPWLLLGTKLGLDGASRWLLGMSVLLWLAAATLLQAARDPVANDRPPSFFLLTLGGSLGVILAMDMASFFVFSTLMGYGFYGLLVSAGGHTAQRAGRGYLVVLILADLALFEGLLIAATTTEDLGFESVRQAVAQSDSQVLYLSMILLGFALKAGIWPLHFWLQRVFRSSQPAVALILPAAPIALAMLGAVRWLPLGEMSSPGLGLSIQVIGVAAMLYAILSGLKKAQLKTLPFHVTVLATGLFTAALGTGLADAAAWNRYGNWAYYYITAFGLGLMSFVIAIRWLETRRHSPATPASDPWFERWAGTVVAWAGKRGFDTLPRWRTWWLARVSHLWLASCAWQGVLDASETSLQRWAFAITLFLLLGIAVVFVGASSWR